MNAVPAPVVVGLDLSATSELAVDWGASEAALRGCHWLDLPAPIKAALQQEAQAIHEALRRGGSSRCSAL